MKLIFLLCWLNLPSDSLSKKDTLRYYGANRAGIASNASAHLGNFAYTSPLSYLNGAGTGIQIQAPLGLPGSDPLVTVRGKGVASLQPTLLLDGMPFWGSLSDLHPLDIESIEVLKDPISTNMLGGAPFNNIIRVQTKKSSPQSFHLQINSGISRNGVKEPEVLNIQEYYEYVWAMLRDRYISWGASKEDAGILSAGLWPRNAAGQQIYQGQVITDMYGYLRSPQIYNVPNHLLLDANGKFNTEAKILNPDNLDWWKQVARTAQRHEAHASFSKSFRTFRIYTSASHLTEEGWAYHSNMQRSNARIKLSYEPLKWLSIGLIGGGSKIKEERPQLNQSNDNPLYFARKIGPLFPVYAQDPTTGELLKDANGSLIPASNFGPLQGALGPAAKPFEQKIERERYDTRAYLQFLILPGLRWQSNGGFDKSSNDVKQITRWVTRPDAHTTVFYDQKTFQHQHVLSFEKSTPNLKFAIDLGFEKYKLSIDEDYLTLVYNSNNEPSEATQIIRKIKDKRQSYYSQLAATFRKKLKVEASYRSNNNQQSLSSYAVAAYYTHHFSPSWPIEMHASWADIFPQKETLYPTRFNYSLQKNQFSTGVKLRKNLFINYFYSKNHEFFDYILIGELPQFFTYLRKGWEVSLQGQLLRRSTFSWHSSLHVTFGQNKVVSLPKNYDKGYKDSRTLIPGMPIETYELYQFAGIDHTTGESTYRTGIDGVTTTLGYAQANLSKRLFEPKGYGSWVHRITFKRWEGMLVLNYQFGGWMPDQHLRTPTHLGFNYRREVLNTLPLSHWYYESERSDRWLTRSDYLSINSVRISYRMNKHVKIHVNGENLYYWAAEKYLNPLNVGANAYTYNFGRTANVGLSLSF